MHYSNHQALARGFRNALISAVLLLFLYSGNDRPSQLEQVLQRGDRVCVRGQLVQREYNGKIYLDVKNASVTFMEDRRDGGGDSPF